METAPADRRPSDAWNRLEQALQQTFASEFRLLDPERGGTLTPEERRLVERLPETAAPDGPGAVAVEPLPDGAHLVALAWNDPHAPGAVALGRVALDAGQLARQLAHAARLLAAQAEHLEQQSREQEAYVAQVSEDFEELAFLRDMAEHLELSDGPSDMLYVAASVLPALAQAVKAQSLVLVSAGAAANGEVSVERPVFWAGPMLLEPGSCAALVEQLRPAAARQPVVNNQAQRDARLSHLKLVHQLVLVQVACAGQVSGWLLALNKVPPELPLAPWQVNQLEFGSGEAALLRSAAAVLATHAYNVASVRQKQDVLVNVIGTLIDGLTVKKRAVPAAAAQQLVEALVGARE